MYGCVVYVYKWEGMYSDVCFINNVLVNSSNQWQRVRKWGDRSEQRLIVEAFPGLSRSVSWSLLFAQFVYCWALWQRVKKVFHLVFVWLPHISDWLSEVNAHVHVTLLTAACVTRAETNQSFVTQVQPGKVLLLFDHSTEQNSRFSGVYLYGITLTFLVIWVQ